MCRQQNAIIGLLHKKSRPKTAHLGFGFLGFRFFDELALCGFGGDFKKCCTTP